ncbi:LysR substrate-binding domain-containing protein [Rhodococcus sp. NPDC057529]|uniref:LysR substrate-binding domain-containing protein n=1 Tax=Rhodococcus sp. NPDC057529 TaxID=3346158 RepID=UPI00366F9C95
MLKSFVTVAEELHFGRAAARLHMAAPPLSKQILQLEAELGLRLFARSTRSVALTPAGEVFFRGARKVLDDAEEARLAAARAARGELGQISVGFAGSAAYGVVPRLIRRFRAEYPEVAVHLRGELTSPRQVDALRVGDLDVGFVRPTPGLTNFDGEVVLRERLTALVPQDHPLADREWIDVGELHDEDFVSYSGSTAVVAAVHATCQRAGFEPRVLHRANESHTVCCLVAAGMGVALVPQAARHLVVDGACLIPVPAEQSETVTLNMVWRPDDASLVVQNFIAMVRHAAEL